jgi:DNA processing protein
LSRSSERQRRAVLALWSVPGIGPKTLEALSRRASLEELLELPTAAWAHDAGLTPKVVEALLALGSLAPAADRLEERARAGSMEWAVPGDPLYPARLLGLHDAPAVLFGRGEVSPVPLPRLAMVGTRKLGPSGFERARSLARDLAALGIGVVSGAAEGTDQACHHGALDSRGETWAFMGAALDQLGASQAALAPRILDGGGAVFSELPPGTAADRTTFPRRNRLISGAADAVLVFRAGEKSGTLHTARYAREQGRALLVVPGDPWGAETAGCNQLLREGASACWTAEQIAQALLEEWAPAPAAPALVSYGLSVRMGPPWDREEYASRWTARRSPAGSTPWTPDLFEAPSAARELLTRVSAAARTAYAALDRGPESFENLLSDAKLPSAALSAALCELELIGLVVQHPGKRYEKV